MLRLPAAGVTLLRGLVPLIGHRGLRRCPRISWLRARPEDQERAEAESLFFQNGRLSTIASCECPWLHFESQLVPIEVNSRLGSNAGPSSTRWRGGYLPAGRNAAPSGAA